MARKFLYLVAALIVVVLATMLALRFWADDLTELAFVPTGEFTPQTPLDANAYTDPAMWIARPGFDKTNTSRWLPEGASEESQSLGAAVFFVHPTSYFERNAWNAPLAHEESRSQAEQFVRDMASPFNRSVDLWVPRYRQAAFGAFVTGVPSAKDALNVAYEDIATAFAFFIESVDQDRPIVLAGHSQGAFHLRQLLRERVSGTPLTDRVAAAYLIGWPISLVHDLPQLGLPPCTAPDQAGCIMSWLSFAEPADHSMVLTGYRLRGWIEGTAGDGRPFLCTNPLTGKSGGDAPASLNNGTLVREGETGQARLVKGMVPARCDQTGFLHIGDPPDLGRWVLPGNNYHVYDIPLFWADLREDVGRRVAAWKAER